MKCCSSSDGVFFCEASTRQFDEAEALERKQAAEQTRAAQAKAAAQEQALDAGHRGTDCVKTMGRFEIDVLDSLRWIQKAILASGGCSAQHRILRFLGMVPPEGRPEYFDRLLDATHGH